MSEQPPREDPLDDDDFGRDLDPSDLGRALEEHLGGKRSGEDPDTEDYRSLAERLQAEMAAFRHRQAQRAERDVVLERERLLRLLLPVLDDLDRALLKDEEPQDVELWKGVALVRRELMRVLDKEGLIRIDTLGKPFDPTLHEAVATRAVDAPAGTVVQEVLGGYLLADKLLRPAQVVVAR